MESKIFELRDRATFIPICAVKIPSHYDVLDETEKFLLYMAGYMTANVIMFDICTPTRYQAYPEEWGDRTYQVAHQYILEHFGQLPSSKDSGL